MLKTEYGQGLGAIALVGLLVFGVGCGTKNDAISQAGKTEKDRPSIAETKAIAEEGFIYGLPIVMNYAVMYAFCVDKTSSQYKAPFNELKSVHRVFTYDLNPA